MSKRGNWGKICSKLRLPLYKELKEFWCSLKEPPKASFDNVAQSNKNSLIVVLNSPNIFMKFLHTHAYVPPNKMPIVIVKTLYCLA